MICEFYNENLEFQENLLAKYYGKHGHEVVVITSTYESIFDYYSGNHDKSLGKKIYFDGKTKIIKLPYKYNILNKVRPFISISKILRDEKPDLIFVHDIIPNILEATRYVKSNKYCKMIMDYHADYTNSGRNVVSLKILHGIIRKRYLDKALPHLSKIFPVVPGGMKFLHEVYNVPYSKMEVLPLGADVDLVQKIVSEANSHKGLIDKYSLKINDKVIVTGGKITPRKQVEKLIGAVNKLSSNVKLIIIGDFDSSNGDYKKALLKKQNGNPNIHYSGWLSTTEVLEHFAIADLAVFPASQSILWQLAIACGLPLIVGDTGGQSPDYLNLYNNIIILKKNKIQENNLKNEIENLLSNQELYNEMHYGALKVRDECLDWNVLINTTLKFNKP